MPKGDVLAFDLDDEDLKLFCEEADEQLELLDNALVQLEGDPAPDLVQQIFRAAHTLKGSSATIGHKRMASLTHAMESVLDAVRQDRLLPRSDVVDALLAALDALRRLANEVVTKVDSGTEIESLETALHDLLSADLPLPGTAEPARAREPLPGAAIAAARAALDAGLGVVHIDVRIDDDCQLPGIRCYQVLQELDSLGEALWVLPARSVLESGGGELSVTALLAGSAEEDEVQTGLAAVNGVGSLEVKKLTGDLLGHEPAAREAPGQDSPAAPTRSPVPIAQRAAASEAHAPAKRAPASVRIDVDRLDGLMNLVGELVIDRTRLQQIGEQLSGMAKDASISELAESFRETTTHIAQITDELHLEIMRSRMLPIRSVLTRLPRLVRDIAGKCGKHVELTTSGEDTELDRSIIEEISDPLVHILRNAVDHGIESPEERRAAGKPETGVISVSAWNQEGSIYVSIKDDGKGIDTSVLRRKAVEQGLVMRDVAEAASHDAVTQYIFLAGLSTAQKVSDVSGRGVGMDIVRTNIERLNGHVSVRSMLGAGTEIILQLPLTLATTKALLVVSNRTVYALPLVSVTEALDESKAFIQPVGARRTLRLRGDLLPLVDLSSALGDHAGETHEASRYVVAARHGDRQAAFVVDRLLGEQDVVVKSLGQFLGKRRGLTGATILGDGSLGLIVDTATLVSAAVG